jgi:hypothetical protein
MSRRTTVVLIAIGIVMLVVGLLADSAVLAVIGLYGGVVVAAVWALAAGGDWIRDASAGRFSRHGR